MKRKILNRSVCYQWVVGCIIGVVLSCSQLAWGATQNGISKLLSVQHQVVNSQNAILLPFSSKVAKPVAYTAQAGKRLVLQFPAAASALSTPIKTFSKDSVVNRVQVARKKDTLWVVLYLNQAQPYQLYHVGTVWQVRFGVPKTLTPTIEKIGFDSNKNGDGVFRVQLPAGVQVSEHRKKNHLIIELANAQVASKWLKPLDVSVFHTPVKTVHAVNDQGSATIALDMGSAFSYEQTVRDNWLIVTVMPASAEDQAASQYEGKKISLNFQNISVRAVLQVIAEFTGLNVVTSDAVTGDITLHLQDVPWDQALKIILQARGLDQRRVGNVIYIAPAAEIAAQEKMSLEAQHAAENLEPLENAYLRVSYADASSLAALLENEDNPLLSSRGSVAVDARTNTLLIRDTAERVKEIRELLHRLDIPVRQVLIEARIVQVEQTALKELGVSMSQDSNGTSIPTLRVGGAAGLPRAIGLQTEINTGFANPAGTFGITIGRLSKGVLLDLELQALQSEGEGKIISSPHLLVSDNQEAYIQQGQEIPYQTATSSGATSVEFKEAVLGLTVTPQITPDNHIILNLQVNKDFATRDKGTAGDIPIISTREVSTKILAGNGETIVLGGIFENTVQKAVRKVPFLGDLPGVGFLFRNTQNQTQRTEILIFVTPKIIESHKTKGDSTKDTTRI